MAKKKEKDITYTPFGTPYSTYSPDMDDVYRKNNIDKDKESKKYRWVTQSLMAFAVVLGLLFVSNGLYVSNLRNDAEASVQQMNKEMLNVQAIASNDNSISNYENMAKNDSDEDKKTAAQIVKNSSEYVKSNTLTALNPTTNSEDAAIIVAPYFALCDAMSIVKDSSNLDNACNDLTNSAYDMMAKIKRFNHIATSINGKISWTDKTTLPDVAKQ